MLNITVYLLADKCFVWQRDLVYGVVRNQGVLVTSFSTLVIHQDVVLPYNWHYVFLDEGHKIRNPDAQITLACKQVGKQFR